jgi:hypothetical protein
MWNEEASPRRKHYTKELWDNLETQYGKADTQRIIWPILVQNTNLNTLQNTLGILQGIYLLNTYGR